MTSEAGRAERIGAELECQLCLMPKLPAGLHETRRTPEYDEESVPKGLLASHRLRSGSWGEIVVLEGRVTTVRDFGAFVDLGGNVQGLLHVSEMGHGRISDPSTIVKPGSSCTAPCANSKSFCRSPSVRITAR